MSAYSPVPKSLLCEIARAGKFDAVYDVTAISEPKQQDTVVLTAFKMFDGHGVEGSRRFFLDSFEPGNVAMVAASLAAEITERATRAGLSFTPSENGVCVWQPDDTPMSGGYIPGCHNEIQGYGIIAPSSLCPFCNRPMTLFTGGWV